MDRTMSLLIVHPHRVQMIPDCQYRKDTEATFGYWKKVVSSTQDVRGTTRARSCVAPFSHPCKTERDVPNQNLPQ